MKRDFLTNRPPALATQFRTFDMRKPTVDTHYRDEFLLQRISWLDGSIDGGELGACAPAMDNLDMNLDGGTL